MVKVYISSVIDAPADRVWARSATSTACRNGIRPSRTAGSRAGCPSDRVGCIRNFNLKDGGKIREQLLTLSDYDYNCTYSILESPVGVRNYIATLKLTPVTDGNRTFAEWTAEFDCDPDEAQALAETSAMACSRAASTR